MVNSWNVSSPSTWGTRVFTGANGLSSTSKECSIFSGTTPVPGTPTPVRTATPVVTATPTPVQTPTPVVTATPTPGAGNYGVTYSMNDWGSGATVNITIKNNTSTAVNGWTLVWTFSGNQTITNLWSGSYTQSGTSVSVKDAGRSFRPDFLIPI